MNPFKIFGQMPASDSPQFSINALDWQKIAREFGMLTVSILAAAIPNLLGYRYEFGGTDYTIPVIAGLRILLEALRRFTAGQKATDGHHI